MHRHYFFGYGSLVNQRTHDYPDGRPARLHGWRRVWRGTPLAPQAFLSAHQTGDGVIDGLVAAVPDQDWTALDRREMGYRRHSLADDVVHDLHKDTRVQVYAVPAENQHAQDESPILLSYLDVVVQGFLHHFGQEGAAAFFDSTDGWARPVIDDRTAPLYPRHQTLDQAELAAVDRHLDRLGVTKVPKS
ncbi:gamma-glutamylcyclotransferase family protein [Meridianimarinicoccus aquatilis]|uniref:glutathione-specific gamma-glutamylcyclotransferase n=1 Tax=Meridianimarinicoccus aquatilis TaxID=2552766 RepID=A0A4R6B2U6_9RHOB|nr:gamma-glutamylcyclotransferase family protein [Fluviibacterium aquatile]QIE40580.1 gamma-glutamylcyclotransferase [Rhodobacteraceae bacterium SC52]TDL91087.1 gamma-glutamylcyclotransferase [Fluviibacterium aquatile]